MKKIYMLCLLFTLIGFTSLVAQKRNTGFIVKVTGDTLRGYFDFSQLGAAMSMNLRVTFIDEQSNTSIKYAPFQIKGWQLDKEGIFNESKVLQRKGEEEGYAVFMQRLIAKGDVIAYRYSEQSGQMPITEYYLERHQKMHYLPFNKKFYTVLAEYLKDNETLSTAIANKSYKGNKEKALIEILTIYNEWFDANW